MDRHHEKVLPGRPAFSDCHGGPRTDERRAHQPDPLQTYFLLPTPGFPEPGILPTFFCPQPAEVFLPAEEAAGLGVARRCKLIIVFLKMHGPCGFSQPRYFLFSVLARVTPRLCLLHSQTECGSGGRRGHLCGQRCCPLILFSRSVPPPLSQKASTNARCSLFLGRISRHLLRLSSSPGMPQVSLCVHVEFVTEPRRESAYQRKRGRDVGAQCGRWFCLAGSLGVNGWGLALLRSH